ncbi:hypothetical protein R5R35_009036 [Gryllus longicercus]|uniref:C-type lectin domain-containing protein n=1 Tax=Gryllus longicercus TaxID=2509291 RepID=A0AAN9VU90_9ORTH
MSSLLKWVADGNVAILGVLCVMAYLCSADGQTSNYFSFHITSRRNATGHCLVRAIFNIPEPARPMSNNLQEEQETCFDVQQNINTVENRTIIQLVSTFIVADTQPPPGYELVPLLGWYRLSLVPLPWEHARKACEAEGAHLAVLNSQEEAGALSAIFAKAPESIPGASWSHDAFLGFSDGKDGIYRTIFGETINETGYALWHSGQPDRPDEHCGGMSKKDGKLADLPCGASLAYFCEKKL